MRFFLRPVTLTLKIDTPVTCTLGNVYTNFDFSFIIFVTPPPIGGRGIVIERFLCFFVSFFVSLSARLRENGWTNLHEIFREGVEWPWDDLITFWVNSDKLRDAAMLISLSATLRENGWIDLQEIFREGVEWPWDDLVKFWVNSGKPRDAAMLGGGVCCAAHHSLFSFLLLFCRNKLFQLSRYVLNNLFHVFCFFV